MSGANKPAFLNGYTMLFHDRKNSDTYGEMVSWDDDEDAFGYLRNGVGMHPGQGLRALEIQQRIWSFLVNWCKDALSDVSPLTKDEIVSGSEPPTGQETSFTSLEVIAMEAPYQTPARMDLTRLKAIAFAERNAKASLSWAPYDAIPDLKTLVLKNPGVKSLVFSHVQRPWQNQVLERAE